MVRVHWTHRPHTTSLLLTLVFSLMSIAGSLTAPPAASAATSCSLAAHLTIPRHNPRNACQAIAHARSRSTYPPDSCLNFVAQMYGWGSTGWRSPRAMWRNIRPGLRHPHDRTPPAGALAIWRTSNPRGHIALVTRNGVISTDVPRRGRVNEVPLRWITKNWHATYRGWVMPYFPGAS
ncbi:MAG: hypothetical protein H0V07_11515 [Propionibacteriales bacterium]|nr:hypothetical protein [Propionibacteriales bacterium]